MEHVAISRRHLGAATASEKRWRKIAELLNNELAQPRIRVSAEGTSEHSEKDSVTPRESDLKRIMLQSSHRIALFLSERCLEHCHLRGKLKYRQRQLVSQWLTPAVC